MPEDHGDDRLNISYTTDFTSTPVLARAEHEALVEAMGGGLGMTPEQELRLTNILHPTIQLTIVPPPTIRFKLLNGEDSGIHPSIPRRSKEGDAGFDLYASRRATIPVGATVDIHTDIALALPDGFYARIIGRSSTLRHRGLLVNEGIIDNGYRGEMFIAVHNLSGNLVRIGAGERLAQLLIQPVYQFEWEEVAQLPESERGTDGFGSTGI